MMVVAKGSRSKFDFRVHRVNKKDLPHLGVEPDCAEEEAISNEPSRRLRSLQMQSSPP